MQAYDVPGGAAIKTVSPPTASPSPRSPMAPQDHRPRVAIVVSHPIQHFCPMYRELALDPRVELLVLFAEAGPAPRFDIDFGLMVSWQHDILEGYPSTVLAAPEATRSQAVVDELTRFAPDVVYVHGYSLSYLQAAIKWARSHRVPVLLTSDSELLFPRAWYRRLAKRFVIPRSLRHVTMFLTVGDENERYFAHYGIDPHKFRRVPFSIDSAFYDQVLANREQVRHATRERLGIPQDAVVILTVGKMVPHKEQGLLVQALARACAEGKRQAILLIAGEGPDRKNLEALAATLPVEAVKMPGFISVQELPDFYLAADIYAHPSSFDPHPLAVSEAIYCGLPIVVSDRVGSTGPTDDVQVGRNGWVFPNGDVPALAAILADLIDQPSLRQRAGQQSTELGHAHSAVVVATRFADAVLAAHASSQRGPA